MAERRTQWLGSVLLEPRVSSRVFVTIATVAATAVLLLLLLGSYTRKAQVGGWLVPQQGLARIFSHEAAVVTHIHAREGMRVERGVQLVSLSADVESETKGATREEVLRRLTERRTNLTSTKLVQQKLFEQQSRDLQQRLDSLIAEQPLLNREIAIQRDRIRVAEKALRRGQDLSARGLVTITRLEQSEQLYLEQSAKLQALDRSRSTLQQRQVEVRGTLQDLPLRHQGETAEIDRSVAALEQEIAEAEARRQFVITAPVDGTVTAIQAEIGSYARPSTPLMNIIPAGSQLQAQLFCPSRAIGFVKPGQRVLLRYQPFPYQKFGFYEGVVASVSRTAMSPSELGQQLTGLTGLYSSSEPIYRITVDLTKQTVTAYGQALPLHPGMQVEADILIETRRLFEWMLDPLYSLTGRL